MQEIITHQVIFNKKLLISIIATKGNVTSKEIQKKNCFTLIVKDCNVLYSANEIIAALKKLIGDKILSKHILETEIQSTTNMQAPEI